MHAGMAQLFGCRKVTNALERLIPSIRIEELGSAVEQAVRSSGWNEKI